MTTGHPAEVPIDISPPKDLGADDGRWCGTFVACGGRHTLALVEWRDLELDHDL